MSEDQSTRIVHLVAAPPGWEAVFHPIDSPKGDFRTPVGAWALIETGEPPVQQVVGVVATAEASLKPITEFDDTVEFVRYEVCIGVSSESRYEAAVRSR
ncbi:MAG: hypothetical protein GTO18_15345 [Anaerolineales bacterium]|nr:hypothetical protein [Anaerolineales bacterium]